MIYYKNIDDITEEDLRLLLENQIPEGRMIDYKRELPKNDRQSKIDFLTDISAFANASGGLIIYGIDEKEGIPVSITGIHVENKDDEILRLDQLILAGITPRLPQVKLRFLTLESQKDLLLISIPKSWSAPHVVNYQKHWRFHIRSSAGNHQMDLEEVRMSMLQSNNLPEKVRQFRDTRLSLIRSDESPVPLSSNSYIVLHLIPYSAVLNPDNSAYDFSVIPTNRYQIKPIHSTVHTSRYNLEGYLNYGHYDGNGRFWGYVQTFRNGIIESVDTMMLKISCGDKNCVPSYLLEKEIMGVTRVYLDFQRKMGISPPITIFLSLLRVKNYYLAVNSKYDPYQDRKFLLQRENLILPELILDSYPDDIPSSLRGLFDTLWNSFGWERSFSYDKDGQWRGQ